MANPTELEVTRLGRLQDFLAQDPTNVQLLAEVSDLQLQTGQWQSARQLLEDWLTRDAGQPLIRYRLAIAEEGLGLDSACARLEALVAEGHRHPAVLEALARQWGRKAEWARIRQLIHDEDLHGCSAEEFDRLVLFRVRAAHHDGDPNEAVVLARRWISRRSEQAPLAAYGALASAQIDCERVSDAAELLTELGDERVQRSPELLSASGFVALEAGLAQDALSRFRDAEALLPNQGRALLGMGLSAASLGDVTAAINHLKAATRAQPKHLGTWHALAWLHLIAAAIADAESAFNAALAVDDNFGETHGGLALTAALRGKRESADALLRVANRLDPQSMNALVAKVVLNRGALSLSQEVLDAALHELAGRRPGSDGLVNQLALRLWRRRDARS